MRTRADRAHHGEWDLLSRVQRKIGPTASNGGRWRDRVKTGEMASRPFEPGERHLRAVVRSCDGIPDLGGGPGDA
ncbi:MAG: hypothetical protein GXY70_00090 [Euryarchaeota archaeon]|nr:hypothetical protein [Euryarchaeota archaeon]